VSSRCHLALSMTRIVERALMPFAGIGILMIALLVSLPALRAPVALTLLMATALLLVLRPIEREMRSNSQFKTRVLLIGHRPIARKFMDEIERFPERGYTIIGIVEESPSDQTQRSPFLVLGTIEELQTIVAAVKPDLIVVALSDRRGRMPVLQLLEFQSNGIRVEDVADAYECISGKLPIEVVTPGQLIASQQLRKSQALKMAQRVLSFTAGLILLALFAPILGIIAVAIKIDSGGPILFRQTRLGKGCRPFQLMKFRTMLPVERPPSEWVRDNFERITRVGKWLRRLRFDELPQLVNVIRGDMNLVGPRPHPVGNLQLFRVSIPYYALRGSIRPGITGWAQVRYHYANNLEEETEKMRYDLYYIKHMSIWMDLKILLKTCAVFVRSLASSLETKNIAVTRPTFAAGPTRLHVRSRAGLAAARAAVAEDTHYRRPPLQP
jgi:exopolysaccharide biosynthesis polyprenyl glycosylphosphotransferase